MLFQQSSAFLLCSLLFFQIELNYHPCWFVFPVLSQPITELQDYTFLDFRTASHQLLIFDLPISPIAHQSFKTNAEKREVRFCFLASTSFCSTIFILVREKEKLEKGIEWKVVLEMSIAADSGHWTGLILEEPSCSLLVCACLCLHSSFSSDFKGKLWRVLQVSNWLQRLQCKGWEGTWWVPHAPTCQHLFGIFSHGCPITGDFCIPDCHPVTCSPVRIGFLLKISVQKGCCWVITPGKTVWLME